MRHKENKQNTAAITEQELLSMPDGDYMNEVQLGYFHQLLLTLREEILNNSKQTITNLQQTHATPDETDRATQEEEQILEQRIRDRERKLLYKIDLALISIQNKTYGYCETTGKEIGLKRLLVRPTASLCIEEQEKHERKERLFGA